MKTTASETVPGLPYTHCLVLRKSQGSNVASQYNQSQLNPFYSRNKYARLFAEDSWHVLPNLTLNYGLRWDRIAACSEKYNRISTFVAGAQSVVFPGGPAGILYPGDQVGGRAYQTHLPKSATAASRRFLGRMLGAPGATSIRVSGGNFCTAIDALSISVAGCECSLRRYLHRSRASSLRHRLHQCGQWAEQWAALSLYVCI